MPGIELAKTSSGIQRGLRFWLWSLLVFALVFPGILVANVAEGFGGLIGLFRSMATLINIDISGRGLTYPVGLLAKVAFMAIYCWCALGAFLGLVVASLLSVVNAFLESLAMVFVSGALLDVGRLRGKVARDDPRYGRKWGARGALAALAVWAWICVLTPLLSRFGSHPAAFPTLGRGVFLFVLFAVLCVLAGRVLGRLLARPAREPLV